MIGSLYISWWLFDSRIFAPSFSRFARSPGLFDHFCLRNSRARMLGSLSKGSPPLEALFPDPRWQAIAWLVNKERPLFSRNYVGVISTYIYICVRRFMIWNIKAPPLPSIEKPWKDIPPCGFYAGLIRYLTFAVNHFADRSRYVELKIMTQ